MNIVFYKTNDVFKAEEVFISKNITVEIVPTPVQDKAYCGVCLLVKDIPLETIHSMLDDMEYQIVQ